MTMEATRQKACDVISRYFENFTLFSQSRLLERQRRGLPNYQLLIISEDDSLVKDLIRELKSTFNQETILEIPSCLQLLPPFTR